MMTYTRTDGHVNKELEFCAKNSQQRQRNILASFTAELVNQPAPPRLSAVASSGCITTHLAAIKRCKVVSIPLHRWTSNNQLWFIPTTHPPTSSATQSTKRTSLENIPLPLPLQCKPYNPTAHICSSPPSPISTQSAFLWHRRTLLVMGLNCLQLLHFFFVSLCGQTLPYSRLLN